MTDYTYADATIKIKKKSRFETGASSSSSPKPYRYDVCYGVVYVRERLTQTAISRDILLSSLDFVFLLFTTQNVYLPTIL